MYDTTTHNYSNQLTLYTAENRHLDSGFKNVEDVLLIIYIFTLYIVNVFFLC